MYQLKYSLSEKYTQHHIVDNVTVFVVGAAFHNNQYLSGQLLAETIYSYYNRSQAYHISLNGFYSFLIIDGASVFFGVDHMRSNPLFYYVSEKQKLCFISDDPYNITNHFSLTRNDINIQSKLEYYTCGVTCSDRTLINDLFQVEPDSSIYFNLNKANLNKINGSTFDFEYGVSTYNIDELSHEYDKSLTKQFEHLITYANGAKIVIPLSGGLDSLLVASYLKRMKYDNVLAFTYGRANSKEAQISKMRANQLNIPWYFVPYTESSFQGDWNEMKNKKTLTRLSSVPHIQDYSAIKFLVLENIIPVGSVVVPGHTIIGVPTSSDIMTGSVYSEKSIINDIVKHSFELDSGLVNRNFIKLRNVVYETLGQVSSELTTIDVVYLYELWQWKVREPKYLVNSVTNYELWGLKWWLPLWDFDSINFRKKMPVDLLLGRSWYSWYINNLYAQEIGACIKKEFSNDHRSLNNSLYISIRTSQLGSILKNIYRFSLITSHPLCFNAIYSRNELFSRLLKGKHLLSKYAEEAFHASIESIESI